ncbi:hypothetical protein Ctob_008252 [Chrysochromulina tobinii]|uniref:GAIN-B domain-containing protein n=1 Tax=Chrysochromulina tobinii TaxID=1460289 RepID=A0A0M0J6F3_9EUKA|nr:hypothetical protein Ctob_008252 [Chrysochromulina tobinii]|eukprot:KOO22186.1 hypothetical protein Ctob_008252 [Chrysochromulina sp. CCMP291]
MEVLAFITVGIGALPLGGDDVSDEATAEDLAAATATAATELAAVLATVQQLDTVAAQAVTSGLSALFGLMSASDGSPSSASASEQISAAVEQMARAATAAALATTAVPSSGIAEPVVLSSPNLNMTINVRSASALAAEPISCDSGTGVAAAVSVPTDLINVIPGLDQSVPVAAVLHTSRVNLHGGLGGSGAAERRRQRRRRRLTSESMSPGHPAGNGTAAGPTISIKISQQGTELVVKDAATPIIISLAYQSPAAAAGRLPCVGRPDSLSDAARACATTVECRFWNETEDSWSTNGCATTMGADGSVGCSCTHLTEFIAFEFPTTVEELREVALGAVAFVSLESSAFECALDPARSWRTPTPLAVDNVTGLPQEEAGPAVVINPVAIIISATLTAVICIPVGLIFGWVFDPIILVNASLTFTWKNKDWASVRKILLGWTLSLMLFAIMCFTFVLYGCQLFEPQDWVGDDGGGDNNSSVGSNDGLAVVRTIPLIKQAGNPVELIISWLLSCFQRFVLLEPSLILANKGLPMLFASAFCANCCGNAIIESVSLLFVIMTEFVKSMSN